MKKTLKNTIQSKINFLNKEINNLELLEKKINEQMTKIQIAKIKSESALLIIQQILNEVKDNGR